jgi:hypothetical protein
MRPPLLLLLGLVLATFHPSHGQSINIHPVVRDLLSNPLPIDDIHPGMIAPVPIFPLPDAPNRHIRDAFQYLVRNEQGLFLVPDGTGRIYQVMQEGEGIRLVRRDSTIYFGYNYGMDLFTYNDTLFSIGGEGFWRVNGHLRYYSPVRHEWEAEKLNMELPLTRSQGLDAFLWLDRKNGNYYRVGISLHTPTLRSNRNENSVDDRVVVLNLKTRTWTELGRLASRVGYRIASTPWGELALDDEKEITGTLLHFPSNRRWALRSEKAKMIYNFSNAPFKTTIFYYYRDSALHIGQMNPPALYTVPLVRGDFIETAEPIYESSKMLSAAWSGPGGIVVAIGATALLGAFAWVFFRHNRKKSLVVEKNTSAFTSRELAMLDHFFRNSDRNYSSTIEEVNDVLGLRIKSIDVQKKHRSDTILSINEKHRLITGLEKPLITKVRTAEDKRSYLYYLDVELYQKIQKNGTAFLGNGANRV